MISSSVSSEALDWSGSSPAGGSKSTGASKLQDGDRLNDARNAASPDDDDTGSDFGSFVNLWLSNLGSGAAPLRTHRETKDLGLGLGGTAPARKLQRDETAERERRPIPGRESGANGTQFTTRSNGIAKARVLPTTLHQERGRVDPDARNEARTARRTQSDPWRKDLSAPRSQLADSTRQSAGAETGPTEAVDSAERRLNANPRSTEMSEASATSSAGAAAQDLLGVRPHEGFAQDLSGEAFPAGAGEGNPDVKYQGERGEAAIAAHQERNADPGIMRPLIPGGHSVAQSMGNGPAAGLPGPDTSGATETNPVGTASEPIAHADADGTAASAAAPSLGERYQIGAGGLGARRGEISLSGNTQAMAGKVNGAEGENEARPVSIRITASVQASADELRTGSSLRHAAPGMVEGSAAAEAANGSLDAGVDAVFPDARPSKTAANVTLPGAAARQGEDVNANRVGEHRSFEWRGAPLGDAGSAANGSRGPEGVLRESTLSRLMEAAEQPGSDGIRVEGARLPEAIATDGAGRTASQSILRAGTAASASQRWLEGGRADRSSGAPVHGRSKAQGVPTDSEDTEGYANRVTAGLSEDLESGGDAPSGWRERGTTGAGRGELLTGRQTSGTNDGRTWTGFVDASGMRGSERGARDASRPMARTIAEASLEEPMAADLKKQANVARSARSMLVDVPGENRSGDLRLRFLQRGQGPGSDIDVRISSKSEQLVQQVKAEIPALMQRLEQAGFQGEGAASRETPRGQDGRDGHSRSGSHGGGESGGANAQDAAGQGGGARGGGERGEQNERRDGITPARAGRNADGFRAAVSRALVDT